MNIKVSDKLNYMKIRNKPTCGSSVKLYIYIPKMSKIILILDMDLNKDPFYSEIQLALEIKPEKHCIQNI